MPFTVYDYRNPEHVRNLLVTPEMRSRILRMEPGQGFNARHSHDLGHEIFLILQGVAEFEIEGDIQMVKPGQLCFALTDEAHSVRVVGDEPVIMYLSVTPHIVPTHTGRTPEGEARPVNFSPARAYDVDLDPTTDRAERIARHRAAVESLADVAAAVVSSHVGALDRLDNAEDAEAARADMWKALYPLFKAVSELGDSWNDLSYDITESTR